MLNSGLDRQLLHGEYLKKQRLVIRNVLQDDIAERLLHSLQTEVPWQLAYMSKGVPCVLAARQLAAMTDEQRDLTRKKIMRLESGGFQFCYGHYSVTDQNLEQCAPDAFINRFRDYVRSSEFLEFAKTVSGLTGVRGVEVLAARFTGGDFLMAHDDTQKPRRRVAFVFNLNRDWNADWGGLTHFYGPGGVVADTYVPSWNTLTLFSVPVLHSVSAVMPFAPRPRFTVTGWLSN